MKKGGKDKEEKMRDGEKLTQIWIKPSVKKELELYPYFCFFFG